MAFVDKQSIRGEVDRLKSWFAELKKKGKVTRSVGALIKAMFLLMVAVFLEKKTNKTSKNSNKPSPQNEKDESSLGQKGSNGKGKKENSTLASNARINETVTLITVDDCNSCGRVSDVNSDQHERRTKIDIIYEKRVEHIDGEIKECPDCMTTVKAPFPSDTPVGMPNVGIEASKRFN